MFEKDIVEQVCSAMRTESQATARRLNAVADLMQLRYRQHGDRADWVADAWDEISAELAAALRISRALASRYMSDAEVLRERLPRVGGCLAAGDIDYAMFCVIATRTALITDEAALAAVDEQLALRAPRWPSLRGQRPLSQCVAVIVGRRGGLRQRVRQYRPGAGSPVERTCWHRV